MWIIYVGLAVWFVLSACVMFFQAETIRRLSTDCSIYSLKTRPDVEVVRQRDTQIQREGAVYDGVAVALLLGSPRWFQNRYPMMINLLLGSLPENWVIQLFYHPTNKMSMEGVSQPGILKQIKKGNLIVTPVPLEYKKMKRKDILASEWLWEKGIIPVDKVLLWGGTNGLCANSYFNLGNFTNLDYIGTPWNENNGLGGDGGISIRDRLKVLESLKSRNKQEGGTRGRGREDTVLLRQLDSHRIATKDQTLAFGMNDGSRRFECSETKDCPLAYQGTLAGMSDEQRISAIEFCPEIKAVFPVMHSPACFGANPQPLNCFKFLCERGGLKCDEETSGQLKYKVGKKRSTKQGTLSIKF